MAKGKKKMSAAQRAHMAKAKGSSSKPASAPPPSTRTAAPVIKPMSAWVFWSGSLLLLAMAALSLNLSLSHLGYATPGCGEGGSCDRLKETRFAYVPGTYRAEDGVVSGWPVAYVGLAYFATLLVIWVASSGTGLNTIIRQVIRVGAVASAFYLIVMLTGVVDGVCPLCLATHLLNFALLGLVEFATPKTRAYAGRSIGIGLAGLVIGNAALLGVQASRADALAAQADEETRKLIDLLSGAQGAQQQTPGSSVRESDVQPVRFDLPGETHGDGRPGFTGRYLIGPEDAPIRIVTVSGYQCNACQTVETELKRLLETRDDVSVSLIHFPASSSCNPTLHRTNMHPAACETAQMAEAAGILGGPEAFWAMSFRLFEYMSQRDAMGNAPRNIPEPVGDRWIREFGFEVGEFRRLMASSQVADLIGADTRLARSVGTNQTPVVFINGEEFRAWNTPGQLTRTVRGLAAANLPRQNSANDSPPGAGDRLVETWRTAVVHQPVRSVNHWGRYEGPAGSEPRARIVVWGCYDESNTQQADAAARQIVSEQPGVSYEFRFFPYDIACNQRASGVRFPNACVKAKASVAAGLLGGAEAHLLMHDWLMDQKDAFNESDLPEQFAAIGLDPNEAMAKMDSQEVAVLIQTEGNALRGLPGVGARPAVFVNERSTPWIFGSDMIVLPDIVEAVLRSDQR
ncbi:MAG: thioredoxin domain-containing protein [Phycisphaerales bacterium]